MGDLQGKVGTLDWVEVHLDKVLCPRTNKQTNNLKIKKKTDRGSSYQFTEKYQVIIGITGITGCKKDEIQIKAKENVLSVDGKLLEVKPDGTKVAISFSKRFNLPNDCQMNEITSNVSNNQLLITAPKKTLVKTGFRSVPIVFSQENSKDEKKTRKVQNNTLKDLAENCPNWDKNTVKLTNLLKKRKNQS